HFGEEPMADWQANLSKCAKPACALAALLIAAAPAPARVTKIVIGTKVSPAFNGQSFGSAGQYETLAGYAFGELDPNDPHNAIIQDIKLAPRNARGMVVHTNPLPYRPASLDTREASLTTRVPRRG